MRSSEDERDRIITLFRELICETNMVQRIYIYGKIDEILLSLNLTPAYFSRVERVVAIMNHMENEEK